MKTILQTPVFLIMCVAVFWGTNFPVVKVALGFICWFLLMQQYGSQYATYSVMLIPVIGVITSFIINQEPMSVSIIIGLIYIVISVFTNSQEKN